jgi:pimeloyl-ACP methyl ester carboxylesterase
MFSNIMSGLATEYRVTAYDLRGHGSSDVTPTGYTSAEMTEDFKKLHAALRLGPAILVGHSFGAIVAMHTAVLYPDLVAGLILADPFFPGLGHIEPNLAQANVWHDVKDHFTRAGIDLGAGVDFANLFRVTAALTPEQKHLLQQTMDPGSLRWLSQLPRLATTTCGNDVFAVAGLTAERICAVQKPVVALYDEHTPFAATRQYLEEHLPNCKVDVVPGASHVAPLQNPEAFLQLVQKHLRGLVSR